LLVGPLPPQLDPDEAAKEIYGAVKAKMGDEVISVRVVAEYQKLHEIGLRWKNYMKDFMYFRDKNKRIIPSRASDSAQQEE